MRIFFFIASIITGILLYSCSQPVNEKIQNTNLGQYYSDSINFKLLIGSWCDSTSAALHFTIMPNGRITSDNSVTLLYEKWQLGDSELIITEKSIGNHITSVSDVHYFIKKLTKDILILQNRGKEKIYYRLHPIIINIKGGDKIESPVIIRVNSLGRWHASEGLLGTVTIFDENGNILNRENKPALLYSADGKWMKKDSVIFETSVMFDSQGVTTGTIKICSNPGEGSGDEAGVKYCFKLPVKF